ncbi:unnamed protein product, partial [Phaeothamnion confervicola]
MLPFSLPSGSTAAAVALDGNVLRGAAGAIVQFATGASRSSTSSERAWRLENVCLGRHIALHRFKLWWLKPSHGSGGAVPPETAFLLGESSTNEGAAAPVFWLLLPLVDGIVRCTLRGVRVSTASVPPNGDGSSSGPEVTTEVGTSAGQLLSDALEVYVDTGDDATALPAHVAGLLVLSGPDPFALASAAVRIARDRRRAELEKAEPAAAAAAAAAAVAAATATVAAAAAGCGRPPRFVDHFGWCTWDSFYTMVTPAGVIAAVESYKRAGLLPRWVVVDDGWQSTTNNDAENGAQWGQRLVSLAANKRFTPASQGGEAPAGLSLAVTVAHLKGVLGVEAVLLWHAFGGYWAGVDPTAPEMVTYRPEPTHCVAPPGINEVDPAMQAEFDLGSFGMVPASEVGRLYDDYHRYLRSCGVDGVKVDAQSIVDALGPNHGGAAAMAVAYHGALSASVTKNFGSAAAAELAVTAANGEPAAERGEAAPMIHCMCHAPVVLSSISSLYSGRPVVRGSDDFYPAEDASHGPHLYTNAFNALLLSRVGLHDWDMFQTHMPNRKSNPTLPVAMPLQASEMHAASRAISGGPVYVSDRPGTSDTVLLRRLVLPDGSVLRAASNAQPTLRTLFQDPQVAGGGLLSVWALNALAGTGVVGFFNIRGARYSQTKRTWIAEQDLSGVPHLGGSVRPSDVHGLFVPSAIGPEEALMGAVSCEGITGGGSSTGDGCSGGGRDGCSIVGGSGAGGERSGLALETFAVYLHTTKCFAELAADEELSVGPLGPFEYEIATVCRVRRLAVGAR